MKFVTIREFRNKMAEIRKDIEAEREIVLTANGRPFALVSRVDPDTVEDEIVALRRARARVAIARVQAKSQMSVLPEEMSGETGILAGSEAPLQRRGQHFRRGW